MEKTYFITKEQYQAVKQAWTARNSHSAAEIIIYNILRSKPIRNGFVERGRNIQGNSPWYAFRLALKDAQWMCSTTNPYEVNKTLHTASHLRSEERITRTKAEFRKTFGIEMPEGIMALLKDEQ
jgi:hypothetical protein